MDLSKVDCLLRPIRTLKIIRVYLLHCDVLHAFVSRVYWMHNVHFITYLSYLKKGSPDMDSSYDKSEKKCLFLL